MFDVGFAELLLIGVVALLVLGPERLPKAARMAGLWMRKARASWYSMRAELERELADEELKRSLQQARSELQQARDQLHDGGRALLGDAGALGQTLNREVAALADDAAARPAGEVAQAPQPAPVPLEQPVPPNGDAGKPAA